MNKKYVLFDLDGTLTDSKPGITGAVRYSLKRFGIDIEPEDAAKFIGPPLRASYKKYCPFTDEQAETAVQKYREYYSEKGMFENSLYNGVADMLEALRGSGKVLAVATAKADFYVDTILSHFSIRQYFSFLSGSEPGGARSEKSEIIAYALRNLNVSSPGEAVMVGDKEYDITGAKANGIESVGVLYGYGSCDELKNAGAGYIVKNVAELKSLLLGK